MIGLTNMRASLAAAAGDDAEAAQRYGEVLGFSVDLGSRWMISMALLGLARAAARTQLWDPAVRLQAAAELLCQSTGAPLSRGRSKGARHLDAARDALGDDVFEQAWSSGRAMDLATAVEEGSAVASDVVESARPAIAPRTAAAPRGGRTTQLTEREGEVLRLVAQGRSNREIAAELVLSVRTVENHVAHIYAKLGVKGRVGATLHALDSGQQPS